ncbi:MAG: ankyrin repeat domain-containing protein, partial [Synergistaceae bacterium]|nr:ankyrin repeat domain-containing protein [Synergistaceae bacterium]
LDGLTALHRVLNADYAAMLIASGADVNARDSMGHTPLMSAAFEDDDGILTALLNSGAEVNAQDREGRTALMYAAEKNLAENVKILLNYGADSSLRDIDGKSAADLAGNDKVKSFL